MTRIPGFDGEYGTIRLFTPEELDRLDGQLSLFDGQTALTAPPVRAGSQGLLKPEYPSNLISEAHLHKAASNQDKPDILSSFTEGKEAEIPKKTFINENQRLAIEASGFGRTWNRQNPHPCLPYSAPSRDTAG